MFSESQVAKRKDFDGIMHLHSIEFAHSMKTNMFSYKNAPFTQVVSGLKDKDCILTVQLNQLKENKHQSDKI